MSKRIKPKRFFTGLLALVLTLTLFPAPPASVLFADTQELTSEYVVFDVVTEIAKPVAGPQGGIFAAPQQVVLYAEEGAKIFFTTDGTEPTVYSALFTEPIMVAQSMTIRAIAARLMRIAIAPEPPSGPTGAGGAAGVEVGTNDVEEGAYIDYATEDDKPTEEDEPTEIDGPAEEDEPTEIDEVTDAEEPGETSTNDEAGLVQRSVAFIFGAVTVSAAELGTSAEYEYEHEYKYEYKWIISEVADFEFVIVEAMGASIIAASSNTSGYADWAAFLDDRCEDVFGTTTEAGDGNLAPLFNAVTDIMHLRQSSQSNANRSAVWAFNHTRPIPAGNSVDTQWFTAGVGGNAFEATGTIGIAVDLMPNADSNDPWIMADKVVLFASYANNPAFTAPGANVRGIGRISIESGTQAAFAPLPTTTGNNTGNWGTFADNPAGLADLYQEATAQWRTFGDIVTIQSNNQYRIFVFELDEPVPVRYLRAVIEIIVPDGTPGNLPSQVAISAFEVYNTRGDVTVPPAQHGVLRYANTAAFIDSRDPQDTGFFGTATEAGPGNLAPQHISAATIAHLRQSSQQNAGRSAVWAFNHLRSTPIGSSVDAEWITAGAGGNTFAATGTVGIAIDLLSGAPDHAPWIMADTVVLHASYANNGVFTAPGGNRGIGRISIESGTQAAFDPLPTTTGAATGNWGTFADNSAGLAILHQETAAQWRTFSEITTIQAGNPYRVFVFQLDEPVPVRYLRAVIEIIVPDGAGNLPSQISINYFEVYNTRGDVPVVVAAPTANPEPGHFRDAQQVTLSTETIGADIFFTIDGSDPTTASTEFAAPIDVYRDMAIRAIAVLGNYQSGIAEFRYSIGEFASSPFAEFYLNQRGAGFAVIDARYEGMSNVIGRPALIDAERTVDRFPVFRAIDGIPGTVINAVLYGPNDMPVHTIAPVTIDAEGNARITIPDTVPLVAMQTYRMSFTLTYDGRMLRDSRFFTPINNFANYASVRNDINSNNANVANVHVDDWANPFPALQLVNGRLVYFPDYRGNRIMDYSSVGFSAGSGIGGAEIPNVPIVRELGPFRDPHRDAWRMIQDAIDEVSRMPLDENGFRGAIYLREGVYRISQPLLINTSGVVLRGAGAGAPNFTPGMSGGNFISDHSIGITSFPLDPTLGLGPAGSIANPMTARIACQDFEPGVTKLIATWQINPDYTQGQPATDGGGTTGVYRIQSTSVNRDSSNNWDTLIHFIGPPILGTSTNFHSYIVDQYVGAGQYTLHLENVDGLNVGDLLFIHRAIDTNWARATYMNAIGGPNQGWVIDGQLAQGFRPAPRSPLYQERYVVAIDPVTNAVTFDVAMPDNMDMRWGTSYVIRYAADNRIRNVGVENIQGISHVHREDLTVTITRYGITTTSFVDENRPMQFISMSNVVDGWARNWVSYHFDRGFTTNTLSRNITVQDVFVLDPVSLPNAGSRRYSLYIRNASRILMQRAYAHYARHAFSWSSYVSGPSVFFDAESPFPTGATEPHYRWSSGGLLDNVAALFHINNRWSMGTSHGWSGVNYVMYNTYGAFIMSQPQIAANYIIGHRYTVGGRRIYGNTDSGPLHAGRDWETTGRFNYQNITTNVYRLVELGLNAGIVPNFRAYEYGLGRGRPVNPIDDNMPDSLFLQQVHDTRGQQGVDILAINIVPPRINHPDIVIDPIDDTDPLVLTSLRVDGVEIEGFAPDIFRYIYTLPLGFVGMPVITAYSAQNVDIIIELPATLDRPARIVLVDRDHNHNREVYEILFVEPSRFPVVSASWWEGPPHATGSNFPENLLLGQTAHPDGTIPRWASNVNPTWIQLYLGYTPKSLEGITIGFTPANNLVDIRTFFVRFEYSMDGRNWSPITSGTVFSPENPTPVAWEFEPRPTGQFVRSLPVEAVAAFPDNGLQTFTFNAPADARIVRIWADGRVGGATGLIRSEWNNFWHLSPVFEGGGGFVDSQSVTLSGADTVEVGQSVNLSAVVAPSNATFDDVFWISSDPTIAYVDSRGAVVGISPGAVTITAHTLDGVVAYNEGIVTPFASDTHVITVVGQAPATSAVNFTAGTGGSVRANIGSANGPEIASGDQAPQGIAVVFTAIPNTGFRAASWTVGGQHQAGAVNSIFVVVEDNDISVNVSFERIDAPPADPDDTDDGWHDEVPVPTPAPTPTPPPSQANQAVNVNQGDVELDVTTDNRQVILDLPEEVVNELVEISEGEVVFDVSDISDENGENIITVVIPAETVRMFAEAELGITFMLPYGSLSLDAEALNTPELQEAVGKISFSVEMIRDIEQLNEAQQQVLRQNDTVFTAAVNLGDEVISRFGGIVTITVAHEGEAPVSVWKFDSDGSLVRIGFMFDEEAGNVTFTTSGSLTFAVGSLSEQQPLTLWGDMHSLMTNVSGESIVVANPFIRQEMTSGYATSFVSGRVFASFIEATRLDWVAETDSVILGGIAANGDEVVVEVAVGQIDAVLIVNGVTSTIDIAATAGESGPEGTVYTTRYGDFIYLPVRFLAVIFGLDTNNMWDSDIEQVILRW